jgi:hypothetical protein
MKTQWIKTGEGTYMQIIVPEWEGFYHVEPPTEAEQIEAAFNYMVAVYATAFNILVDSFAEFLIGAGESMSRLGETLAVLNDDLAMEAIEEAQGEDR